jgi:hypothetical protein
MTQLAIYIIPGLATCLLAFWCGVLWERIGWNDLIRRGLIPILPRKR